MLRFEFQLNRSPIGLITAFYILRLGRIRVARIIGTMERGDALGSIKTGPMFLAVWGPSSLTRGVPFA